MLGNFSCYFCRLLTFVKLNFFKRFHEYEYYQNVKQFGSRSGPTDDSVGLIRVQTICNGYQQMTKVTASKDRVKKATGLLMLCQVFF